MSYGLEIYRADGQLRLSVSDRLTRVLGVTVVNVPSNVPIFVPAPEITSTDWTAKISVTYGDIAYNDAHCKVANGVWLETPYGGVFTVVFIGF